MAEYIHQHAKHGVEYSKSHYSLKLKRMIANISIYKLGDNTTHSRKVSKNIQFDLF